MKRRERKRERVLYILAIILLFPSFVRADGLDHWLHYLTTRIYKDLIHSGLLAGVGSFRRSIELDKRAIEWIC